MISISLSLDAINILAAVVACGYAALVGYWNARPEHDDLARELDWLLVACGVSLIALHMLAKHGAALFLSLLATILLFGIPMMVAVIAARRIRRRRERIEAEAQFLGERP